MAGVKPTPTAPPQTRARVRSFIRSHDLVRSGDRILVGVSGGPDSTCLLLALASLRRSLGFELCAAYFDHQLRGVRAARREREFVVALTERLAVSLACGEGDVRAHAGARRRSLEDAARELRYRFLARAAQEAGCSVVAVGHTRDDQAETLLLHLVRGSGLRGLAAMAPSSSWPVRPGGRAEPPRLVRPLLALSREATETCCREAGIVPLHDPSNRSRAHLRNRVRHELLPLLRRYNPRIDDALVRLADAASPDVELLERLASVAVVDGSEAAVRLSRRELAAMPASLRRHAVRLAAGRLLGNGRGLTDRHVRAVLRANEGGAGARLDLAHGLQAAVEREAIVLSAGERPSARPLPAVERPLEVPGTARLGPWQVQAEFIAPRPQRLTGADAQVCLLDADACGGGLRLRRRRPGDRFQPLGLARPKRLQDFFVDAHVPRAERDAVPLVCSDRGIVWVVGQRPAEWAKVRPETRRAIRLRASLEA